MVESVSVSKCVVSNGTIAKMEHSLGLTGMLEFFHDKLISGYDINRWKPDPTILIYAASTMGYSIDKCILVDDSEAGVRAAIAAGIPVFYYCADAHNPIIGHPLVTSFTRMVDLPELWKSRGWQLTKQ